jgi:CubicO group peptidase (beta-lactamase class C family)
MSIQHLTILLAFVIAYPNAYSQSAETKETISAIDNLIAANLDSLKIEGIAYAVVENTTIISKGFGYADKEAKCLMTDTTVTNFASISKSVTATGIMILDQRKIIDINKPVESYLTTWNLPSTGYDKSEVTVKNILNHRAGLSLMSVPFSDCDSTLLTPKEVLEGKNAENEPVHVKTKPDSAWMYSGGGYTMLELMIEDITGESFNSFMERNLFSPLNMRNSTFEYAQPDQLCKAKHYNEEGHLIRPYYTVGSAAGGLNSTVKDMALFSQELISMHWGKSHLLSKEYFDKMTTTLTPVDLSPFGINEGGIACGLGLFVHKTMDDTVIYHSGGNPGVISYFITSLDKRKTLVLVSNSDNAKPLVQQVLELWGRLANVDLPFFF